MFIVFNDGGRMKSIDSLALILTCLVVLMKLSPSEGKRKFILDQYLKKVCFSNFKVMLVSSFLGK